MGCRVLWQKMFHAKLVQLESTNETIDIVAQIIVEILFDVSFEESVLNGFEVAHGTAG